ncbi:hypothetical protein ASF58_07985 [Methylobacterium sp. Leaf125]|uniref:hypothetical protein n=1 Tax=Methylobacterium sp. Leaf125 TaxID=1736265 RepID=UPI0006FC62DF|nr:hypothetical protein [Methylobacterium sp. Leaf125]KQQ40889.1 hypothetical protein ASF58_07985 [Methylobacterium sp. Leaf125]
MTRPLRAGLLALLLGLAAGTRAHAQPAESTDVVACKTLVALRVLMAAGDRAATEAALPQHPECRRIARARIGAAEHRAMIGGAPFECLSVANETACAWVMP